MEKPFSAYRGDGPYVFVCYAHEDADTVYPDIAWLNDYGVNVWYDEGISPGHEWREELATAIQNCTRVLFFVTPNAVVSEHCRRELNFAQEENRGVVAIHLEPTEVPAGLRLGLNNRQAIQKHDLSEEEYRKRLMRVTHESATVPSQPPAQPRAAASKRGLRIAALVIVLLVALVAIWRLTPQNVPAGDAVSQPVTELVPAGSPEMLHNSIAVLPFDNLSPDPNNAYFAAGVHEETLNQLAKIRDLSVIARTTMMRYGSSDKSVPEIGSELNVGAVMDGSVRYAGERVRVTAQLIDVATGAHLWSEAYDRDLKDIFAIQSDIALKITSAMKAEFALEEQRSIGAVRTENLEAYSEYVRGLALYAEMPPRAIEALDRFQAAIDLDPEFADPLAAKAQVHSTVIAQQDAPQYTPEVEAYHLRNAKELARRALELDPRQPFAHLALSNTAATEWRWNDMLSEAQAAFEINPNHAFTAYFLGQALAFQNRADEAKVQLDRAISLDPMNGNIPVGAGISMYLNERWEDAIAYFQHISEMAPENFAPYVTLAVNHSYLGDDQTALAMMSKAEARLPEMIAPLQRTALMQAYSLLGMTDSVNRQYRALEEQHRVSPVNGSIWMRAKLWNGDVDGSLDELESVIESRFPGGDAIGIAGFPRHPMFDAWRDDPRFEKALVMVRTENF